MGSTSENPDIFSSLTTLSTSAIKFSGLINAGGAVVLLSSFKDLAMIVHVTSLLLAMSFFAAGAILCALTYACAYVTNLRLLQETNGRPGVRDGWHHGPLYIGMFLFVVSVIAFALGVTFPIWQTYQRM